MRNSPVERKGGAQRDVMWRMLKSKITLIRIMTSDTNLALIWLQWTASKELPTFSLALPSRSCYRFVRWNLLFDDRSSNGCWIFMCLKNYEYLYCLTLNINSYMSACMPKRLALTTFFPTSQWDVQSSSISLFVFIHCGILFSVCCSLSHCYAAFFSSRIVIIEIATSFVWDPSWFLNPQHHRLLQQRLYREIEVDCEREHIIP